MRRKDRMMDKDFCLNIIDNCEFGNLALIKDDNYPLLIPLSLVREGEYIYFHSAKEGEKTNYLDNDKEVIISFVSDVKVPSNYSDEELDSFKKDKSKAKELISNVFTTEFSSVLVKGKTSLVISKDEKIKAMKLICEKYTPNKMDYFNIAIEAGLNRVNVYKVSIENLSGKRKKYDSDGKELKWMRQE